MNKLDIPANPPEVVEAFTSAAIIALQELTQFEASLEEVPNAATLEKSNVVAATVRLVRKVPGTMSVILTAQAASRLAERYLPKETLLTEEIVEDVVGEVANVIAGQAKTILKGTPYHFKMSTPCVDRVASFSQLFDVGDETLVASLRFDAGQLLLRVDLPPCPGA